MRNKGGYFNKSLNVVKDKKNDKELIGNDFVGPISDVFICQKVLASGGSCKVLLVQHKKSKRQYAAKQMKKSPKRTIEFDRETSMLNHLKHPNIISMHLSYTADNGYYYIVTSYCHGGTLFDRVK